MLSRTETKRLAALYAVKSALADKHERRMRLAGSKGKKQHFKMKVRKYKKEAADIAAYAIFE